MTEQLTAALWAELRAARPAADDLLETRPIRHDNADSGILAGMDAQGDLHLLVPVHTEPRGPEPPDLTGLRVRRRVLHDQTYLGLVATAPHEPVFTPFCRQVLEAILEGGRDPWAAVASTIRQWQVAWKPSRQQMTSSVQVGLAGELLILDLVLLPLMGPEAVFHWSGPASERHDFICGDVHIEVKTTRAGRHEHKISRLDQLWAPAGRQLLLASVQLEVSIGGAASLATLIDSIVERIRSDGAATEDFLSKLDRLNWSEDMRRSGELLLFHLRDADLYEVDGDFPRFPEGFRPPRGVVEVRYTIDLANLPTMDMDEVRDLIRTATVPPGEES